MMDSGGSTGRLRDQLGVLPPGDVRQALVALSENSEIWRNLFTYRFLGGDLDGHTFGNIFSSTIEKLVDSLPKAIKISQKLLKTRGTILPVTLDKSTLYAKLENGVEVAGEAHVDELGQDWNVPVTKISSCQLSPKASITKEARSALSKANYIVMGPGDLYTSLIPNLLVEGVGHSIIKSKAKKIYIMNLMTRRGQTDNFKAGDFLNLINKYIPKLVFDYILINNGKVPKKVEGWYQKTCEVSTVKDDLLTFTKNNPKWTRTKIVRTDVVNQAHFEKSVADRIQRTLIRHSPEKLGKALATVMSVDRSHI
jgi:uncharacterized cofD-like protein